MRRSLRIASLVGLVIVGTMASIDVSSAMPASTALPVIHAQVEQVAWGCGPGWHPNPWGRCVPNGPGWGWGWHRPWGGGWGWHRWGWHRWGWHRW